MRSVIVRMLIKTSCQINLKLLCLTVLLLQDVNSIELEFVLSDCRRPWPPPILNTTGTPALWSDEFARSRFQQLKESTRTTERNFNTASNWTQTMDLHYDKMTFRTCSEYSKKDAVFSTNLISSMKYLFTRIDVVATLLVTLFNLGISEDSLPIVNGVHFKTCSTKYIEEMVVSNSINLLTCEKRLSSSLNAGDTTCLSSSFRQKGVEQENRFNTNSEILRLDKYSTNGGSGATVAFVLFMMAALLHLYELQAWDLIVSYWKSWYRATTNSSQVQLLIQDTERHVLSTLDERNYSYASRNWIKLYS